MTKPLAIRCPDDLYAQIEAIMKSTGQDKTTVVVTLLKRGLGIESEDATPDLEALAKAYDESLDAVRQEMTIALNSVRQELDALRGKLIASVN
ncbi:hypothetical protein H6G81_23620 [Scytonema hofmannii FACHB-248]|uniref:Uncharacterized protein n=1 Tax=Scytonema hofmannii FACHB-248 TaxID=1842502 RepID=A0ABR8GW98_9CYAN|nr:MULTISPECIES: hypothetical protein [Nostocales]MBD2607433.1 hypothetical protein [Scytonema hofmannii FACHB-248]